jgi:dihydrofolate reductase
VTDTSRSGRNPSDDRRNIHRDRRRLVQCWTDRAAAQYIVYFRLASPALRAKKTRSVQVRTLISMTYVYSVNAASMKDDNDDFRFISTIPDDPAQEEDILTFLAGADQYIMGRVLYEEFARHFQGKTAADHPFAPIYAATDKIVFSSTLATPDWERTTINRGDLITEVERLKSEGDGYIIVTGRSGISRELLHHDLIDEFRITMFPLLSGQGTREFEFDDVGESKPLELVSCRPGTNGVVVLHYRRRR